MQFQLIYSLESDFFLKTAARTNCRLADCSFNFEKVFIMNTLTNRDRVDYQSLFVRITARKMFKRRGAGHWLWACKRRRRENSNSANDALRD